MRSRARVVHAYASPLAVGQAAEQCAIRTTRMPYRIGGGDHKTRVIPKFVQTAFDAQWFYVSVKSVGIVPDLLDNPNGPIAIMRERVTQIL